MGGREGAGQGLPFAASHTHWDFVPSPLSDRKKEAKAAKGRVWTPELTETPETPWLTSARPHTASMISVFASKIQRSPTTSF